MIWNDLREYIDAMRAHGEITEVSGAHWDLEIGVLTELMVERSGPGLLFDDIPGYPHGYRVLTNTDWRGTRTITTLGLNPEATLAERAEEWSRRSRDYKTVPPEFLPTGPVMENVITGADVNLLKFPVPNWHEQDGNRYIGTGDCVIQQDPESGRITAMRMMILKGIADVHKDLDPKHIIRDPAQNEMVYLRGSDEREYFTFERGQLPAAT